MATAMPRTLVFAYSELGVRCLELLLERGIDVVAVFTHEDDPAERRWFRSVAELARKAGLPVETSQDLRAAGLLERVRAWQPELIFSFYYRRLIPGEILRLPRLGAFNMHGSLLPRYRGRAPVNWAILGGETQTGATLHHMVARADAGDIVDQEAVPIGARDTAAVVSERVTEAACRILERRLPELLSGTAPRRAQDESRATKFGRRTPEDGRIDWSAPASAIDRLVRAVAPPFPGAFSEFSGRRLYVWDALPTQGRGAPGVVLNASPLVVATGQGALEIRDWCWQPEEGPRQPPRVGALLGSPAKRCN
jgi:methionyl-tRNA formyltransferase